MDGYRGGSGRASVPSRPQRPLGASARGIPPEGVRALLGVSRHNPALIAIAGAVGLLSFGVLIGRGVSILAVLLAVVAIVAAVRCTFVGWDRLIALILVVVLFVPIGRYRLPGSLPFNLELYRVVVAICLLLWAASLLVDSRVRIVSTAFDPPLLLIMACVLASEITNPCRVSAYGSYVIKSMTFFLSFVLVYYLTATTLRSRESVEFLLKLLASSGAVIGIFAVIEQRTHYNVFDHLHTVLPFLSYEGALSYLSLGGHLRVFGPSEQPIALGAALDPHPSSRRLLRANVRTTLVGRGPADPPRSNGQRLANSRRDACGRGDRLPAPEAEGDEEALAGAHPCGYRPPFRIARHDREPKERILSKRWAHRPADRHSRPTRIRCSRAGASASSSRC